MNSQEYGGDSAHVASRVFFDLDVEGESYPNLSVDVRQSVDPQSEKARLEISELHGYDGPLNYEVFRGSLEFYYWQVVGGKGSMSGTLGNPFPFDGWTFEQEMLVQFEVIEGGMEEVE